MSCTIILPLLSEGVALFAQVYTSPCGEYWLLLGTERGGAEEREESSSQEDRPSGHRYDLIYMLGKSNCQ